MALTDEERAEVEALVAQTMGNFVVPYWVALQSALIDLEYRVPGHGEQLAMMLEERAEEPAGKPYEHGLRQRAAEIRELVARLHGRGTYESADDRRRRMFDLIDGGRSG